MTPQICTLLTTYIDGQHQPSAPIPLQCRALYLQPPPPTFELYVTVFVDVDPHAFFCDEGLYFICCGRQCRRDSF